MTCQPVAPCRAGAATTARTGSGSRSRTPRYWPADTFSASTPLAARTSSASGTLPATVYNHFANWERQDANQDLLNALRDRARLAEGRHAAPSAGIIDSASSAGP